MAFTGTVTFNGEEAKSGILDPMFNIPAVTDMYTVVPGIKARKQVVYLGLGDKKTKTDAGCGDTSTDVGITALQKFWDPARLEVYDRICATAWEDTLYVWSMKNGLDYNDLTDTEIAKYVTETYPEVLRRDALRVAFLGDTAHATAATTGVIKVVGDIVNYNQVDGFWKKLVAAVGVTAADTRRVTISENALGTFALQLALATDKAYDTFKSMLTGATDPRLKSAQDAVILCTQTLFENFLATKESKTLESSFARSEERIVKANFRGIPVIPVPDWDLYIQADMLANGSVTAYNLPHRAVLTTKANLQIGLDTDAVDNLEVWYDRDTKYWKVRGGYKMDVQIPHNFMACIAY